MNSKKRLLLASTALSFSMLMPSQTLAGDPLKEIFGMMTTATGSQVYESQKRNGVAFGTFSARFSMYQPKVINFQAPSMNAGCGGIDFFAGSISLIKKEELVQMGRSIAAGAAVYAFNLAVESICPSCAQGMAWIQDKLDDFNDLVSMSCQDTVDALSEAKVGQGLAKSLTDTVNKDGWQERLGSYAETKVDAMSSWGDFFSERSEDGDAKSVKVPGLKGNIVWDALGAAKVDQWSFATGWEKDDIQELIMSLIGTKVITVGDGDELETTPYAKTVSAEDLLYNKEGEKIELLRCDTSETKIDNRLPCTKIKSGSAAKVEWEGIYPRALKLLNGDGSEVGIRKRILTKQNLTSEQQKFVENADVPMMTWLFMTGKDDGAQEAIANLVAYRVAEKSLQDLMYQLQEILKKAELSATSDAKATQNLIDFLKGRMIEFQSQIDDIQTKKRDEIKSANDLMNTYETLAEAVKAMAASGV
ncbi:conjugal transfer protein TraH [Vibrio parahaemolyticus]|uniref:conjugal transfer protein TraH n=1 Tax=Vibrio TaxID=662 RepID=UPI001CDCE6F5|nr:MULTISPECIES: conjugal transfer protein TraH [Vibrio]MDF5109067.1 conjugal transfer protein TraH [Vibrio parahaemolyticus]MCA2420914.1 conjugal transfer protein TraH [Vibrio alginolyticus]MCA2445689.1 conjugal transfer protein TraH [Vibrio alginolyticus]MDF5143995.1 conjugal transfer protein TraH [Vibrio parahaemolyticus]MDF5154422.1 conjugal transfer protein TraH [Vibrio parahaemolyticus]